MLLERGQSAPHTGPRPQWAPAPVSKATRSHLSHDIWIGLPRPTHHHDRKQNLGRQAQSSMFRAWSSSRRESITHWPSKFLGMHCMWWRSNSDLGFPLLSRLAGATRSVEAQLRGANVSGIRNGCRTPVSCARTRCLGMVMMVIGTAVIWTLSVLRAAVWATVWRRSFSHCHY